MGIIVRLSAEQKAAQKYVRREIAARDLILRHVHISLEVFLKMLRVTS
jgi:hypothetical protein